jgi:hypothetical protein
MKDSHDWRGFERLKCGLKKRKAAFVGVSGSVKL